MKNRILEYCLQGYDEDSFVIKRVMLSDSFYLERTFKELIVSVVGDSRMILPRAIFRMDGDKEKYGFYPIPDEIMNELSKY